MKEELDSALWAWFRGVLHTKVTVLQRIETGEIACEDAREHVEEHFLTDYVPRPWEARTDVRQEDLGDQTRHAFTALACAIEEFCGCVLSDFGNGATASPDAAREAARTHLRNYHDILQGKLREITGTMH